MVTDHRRPLQALCVRCAEVVRLRLDVECTTPHKLFVGDESNGSGMPTLDNGFLGAPWNPTIPAIPTPTDLPGTKVDSDGAQCSRDGWIAYSAVRTCNKIMKCNA